MRRTTTRRRAIAAVVVASAAVALVALAPCAAAAQSAVESGRIEVSAGGAWIGAQTFGSTSATETTPTGTGFNIFSTSSQLGSAPAFDARVGIRIAGSLVVEADASYARPELRIAIANDIESAPPVTAVERIQQFMIGGGATWYAPTARAIVPFVSGGAGYLRQLHDRALLVQTGRYFQAGGGVLYLFASRPENWLKATGIRFDVRALIVKDGVAFDGGRHSAPAVAGSFFARF